MVSENGEIDNEHFTNDYVDQLNYSISTLESSDAPHFGYRKHSAPRTRTEEERQEEHSDGQVDENCELSISLSTIV